MPVRRVQIHLVSFVVLAALLVLSGLHLLMAM